MPNKLRVAALSLLCHIASAPSTHAQQTLGIFPHPPEECLVDDRRVEVLLLGSYHMANPGMDAFNIEADDVMHLERQAEIEALVDRLALFRPTRVAVEAAYADNEDWQAAYRSYRADERSLLPNEREQIGFRLAAQLDHERIYPIDVAMPLNFGAVAPLGQRNPAHGERLNEMQKFGESAVRLMAGWLAEGTVSDMLYRMNQPAVLREAHLPYVRFFLPIAEAQQYAGADMVATWYHRNLRIMANIHRSIEAVDDRIFVVYGQGHIPLLRQFVAESPDLCLVDPLPFLIDER